MRTRFFLLTLKDNLISNEQLMKRLITIFCLCCLIQKLWGLNVNISPEDIDNIIVELQTTTEFSVKVAGSIYSPDVYKLGRISSSVHELDLSDLEIIKKTCEDEGSLFGQTIFSDGEIPAYSFTGAHFNIISLPHTLKKIGTAAFTGSNISEIKLQRLEEIGDYCFSGCRNLKSASIQECTELGIGVFKDCPNLRSVSFGYPVAKIPSSFFDGCKSLDSPVPTGVKEIGNYSYRGTAVKELNLVKVSTIGDFAFADMNSLISVTIPWSTKMSMGKGVFFNDSSLIVLPNIDFDVAPLTWAVSHARIKDVITSPIINEGAYANNPEIDSIFLGSSVREIKAHAFRNLTALNLVDVTRLGDTPPSIDENAFSGLLDETGHFPINLNVALGKDEPWRNHPIWSLFRVGHFVTDIPEIQDTPFEISINKLNRQITVTSSIGLQKVQIFNLNGICVWQTDIPSGNNLVVDLEDDCSVIVRVMAGNIIKTIKLR